MVHSWIGERLAEEHRRDLASHARPQRRPSLVAPARVVVPTGAVHAERANVHLGEGHGPLRRAIGPHVGTLLIRMGTRLGGASMRTS
jgi:hypothetical protein